MSITRIRSTKKKIMMTKVMSTLLQRCNFGSTAVTEDRIIIAGGVKYTEFGEKTKPQTLSIHEMVDLTLKEKETGEIVAEIKKIDV